MEWDALRTPLCQKFEGNFLGLITFHNSAIVLNSIHHERGLL